MRLVSLVPAATEMVWALGATDQLVAVTHDDDFPPGPRAATGDAIDDPGGRDRA